MTRPFRRCAPRGAGVLLALALGATAGAQSIETQIRAEVARYVAAVNSGDARAVARLHVRDAAASTVDDGRIHRGWERIGEIVGQEGTTIRMKAESIVVRPLGRDGAIAVFGYEWTVRGSQKPEHATGAMTLVYARTRQGWRVAHSHTSTLREPDPSYGYVTPITDRGPEKPRRKTAPCRVTRVTDGDGIECEGIGRVRLIGIDTPERDQEPFGQQAARALASFVRLGAVVQLEQDVDARDRYARVLAYVWADGILANWRMVREGWAVLLTYQPNVQYVDWFVEAERNAREEKRGLWATGGFDCRPVDHRLKRCE